MTDKIKYQLQLTRTFASMLWGICVLAMAKMIYYYNFSVCEHALWKCAEDTCSSTCQVVGALHYTTFDNTKYDLEGKACYHDLVRVSCCLYSLILSN